MTTSHKGLKNFDENLKKAGSALGRLFARSQKKLEESGRKAVKTANEMVDTATRTAEKTVESTVEKIHEATATGEATKKPAPPALKSIKSKSIADSVRLLADDISVYLNDNGKTTVEELVASMEKQRRNQGMIFAAIGWLAGEDKVKVTKDGKNISSK
ncbi:MAG: winged helix-turn-helix domain-containing protein [Desulfobulbaceae bacterium]|nr:winged helix-turn-helix domain-containing protein [Desulfobulbaceae bacterium]